MPPEETTTKETETKPEVITKAEFQEFQKNIQAETEKQLKSLRDESVKAAKDAEDKVKGNLAKALGLESEENKEALLLEKFLEKPSDVLAAYSAHAERKLEEKIQTREQAKAEANRAVVAAQQAASRILKERPDIRSNEEAQELVDGFYDKAPDGLDEEAKVKWAVNKYDLLMEKSGSGNIQERVAKAASPTAETSGKPEDTIKATQEEASRSYIDSRVARYKQLSGGRSPR